MTLNPAERRAHPRYPLAASMTFTRAGQIYPANVLDLSKGGLSFLAAVDMPSGEDLTLTLTLIVGTVQAKLTSRGVLRWKQPQPPDLFRYGVAFAGLNPAQLKVLVEFLGGTGAPPLGPPQ